MTTLITLGETMALFSAPRPGRLRDMAQLQLSIAGSESNVAIGVRRLGVDVAWTGRVGGDEMGQLILATLRREDVDVSGAVVDHGAQTALMFKERRFNVSRVSYYRVGYAGSRLCPDDLDPDAIRAARMLHVTGITLALSASAQATVQAAVDLARAGDTLVSFDFNYRGALWSRAEAAEPLATLARQADLVFAGEEELKLLGDNAKTVALELAAGGRRTVVVKRGGKGASVIDKEGALDEPALVVPIVDPVGAGDAFVAGYLNGMLGNRDRAECLRMGCAVAACAIASPGDWESLPTMKDLALVRADAGTTIR